MYRYLGPCILVFGVCVCVCVCVWVVFSNGVPIRVPSVKSGSKVAYRGALNNDQYHDPSFPLLGRMGMALAHGHHACVFS